MCTTTSMSFKRTEMRAGECITEDREDDRWRFTHYGVVHLFIT